MIRSMTGFGRANGPIGERLTVTITIRSVNHRFLETNVRLSESLWELEPTLRSIVSERLSRGKVDVSVRAKAHDGSASSVRIDRKVATALAGELRELASDLGTDGTIGLRDLLALPGVVEVEATEDEIDDEMRAALSSLMREALDQVESMRGVEGSGLRTEISTRVEKMTDLVRNLSGMRETVVADALESYRERVAELAARAGVEIDGDRLAQETVIQVEKGDITEELARLGIHLQQIRELLDAREPVGKKLDFLSQEMLREVNTIGSKSRASEIRTLVVELKSEVERIREQVQNVE